MATLEKVYERAVDARSKCKRRVLLQSEVKTLVSELWDELLAAYPAGSEQWRIVDRSKREHSNWWSVQKMSRYVEKSDCVNIEVVIRAIEEASGKVERKSPAPTASRSPVSPSHVERVLDPTITGRTIWDIFEMYKERHGKKLLVALACLVVLFFVFVYLQTPDNKSVTIFGFNLYTKHGS